MTTGALHSLWAYIDSLALPQKDRDWLAGKLTGSASIVTYRNVAPSRESSANAEIIREKYKNIIASPEIKETMEIRQKAAAFIDLDDERTKYMLGV